MKMIIVAFGLLVIATCVSMLGCAGTYKSKIVYTEAYRPLEPIKDASCYDAAVLLNNSLNEAKDFVYKALAAFDCGIQEERDNYIKARRRMRTGFMSSSGGETIVIEFVPVDGGSSTFVTVATKTHYTGSLGMMTQWSCSMVDQIVRFASK